MISRFAAESSLTFHITAPNLDFSEIEDCCLDLEISGTREQLQSGLTDLLKLPIKLAGQADF